MHFSLSSIYRPKKCVLFEVDRCCCNTTLHVLQLRHHNYNLPMLEPTKKPTNYLNNKDILKEIHYSKSSYCTFENFAAHNEFDVIIDCPTQSPDNWLSCIFAGELQVEKEQDDGTIVTTTVAAPITRAKEARAARISAVTGTKVSADSIAVTDLVFRVMTFDHIPLGPKQTTASRAKNSKKSAPVIDFDSNDLYQIDGDLELDDELLNGEALVHTRVNFHPFQHVMLNEDNTLRVVGKSHWKGKMDSGEFCPDKGALTNNLAKMFLTMCERYAMKYNWRGYTYVEEMRGAAVLQLTYVGLRFNEAKSSNPFAFYTAVITNAFRRVLNTEKRNQNVRDDLLEMNGLNPSWSRQNSGGGSSYEE